MAKIDANDIELLYAEEDSFKTVDGDEAYRYLEVNTFADIGPTFSRTARRPIASHRQLKKGSVTGLDLANGFNVDLLQNQQQHILQGFFHAAFREKPTAIAINSGEEIDSVDGTTNDGFVSDGVAGNRWGAGRGFEIGNLIWTTGFTNDGNNDLFTVDEVTDTQLNVSDGTGLVDEASPPLRGTGPGAITEGAKIVQVGHEFTAGAVEVDVSGNFASYIISSTSTQDDFTNLGVIPGEWIYVGGGTPDTNEFTTAANNGWKRVRSVAAGTLVVDKSDSDMSTEAGGAELLQIFVGRVLKNESDPTLILKKSYRFELRLGNDGNGIMSEGLEGSVPNTVGLNYNSEDKATMDLALVPSGFDPRTGTQGPESASSTGGIFSIVDEDAFNTAADFARVRLAAVSSSDEAPTPLVVDIETLTLSIDNGASGKKALNVVGNAGVARGAFAVTGSLSGYFEDMESTLAVQNNSDTTIDWIMVKGESGAKQGIAIDVPLIGLGNSRKQVQQDEFIMLPLDMEAASGAKVVSTMDHTLLATFFDYLPDAADS